MSEIKVTQADRDCEQKIIKAMVSSSFLPGCFAAAHRQAAMIEGARLMRELAAKVAEEATVAMGDEASGTFWIVPATRKDAAKAILALDPASVVEE